MKSVRFCLILLDKEMFLNSKKGQKEKNGKKGKKGRKNKNQVK